MSYSFSKILNMNISRASIDKHPDNELIKELWMVMHVSITLSLKTG